MQPEPPLSHTPTRIARVDVVKGLAIICVILLHVLPSNILFGTFSWFHIWQAVPVFAFLMGVTGARTRMDGLGIYYKRRARRLGPPMAIAWIVSLLIALNRHTWTWSSTYLIGVLPATGPGNYFVTLLMQYVLLLPIIRWCFDRRPSTTIVMSTLISFGFELVSGLGHVEPYLYSSSILRYLVAIVLGMWVASDHDVPTPLAGMSIGYLVAHSLGVRIPWFDQAWQPQNFLAFGYTALLTKLLLDRLPGQGTLLESIGKASLHIFLVQILWFGQFLPRVSMALPLRVVASIVFCVGVGLIFHAVESKLLPRRPVN